VLAQAGDRFNTGFDRLSDRYGRLTRWLLARRKKVLATYAALIVATIGLFWATPGGFIPAQDQGYFLAVVQLPRGLAGAHRRGDARGRGQDPADQGLARRGDVRRVPRPVADVGAQFGRDLLPLQELCRTRRGRRDLCGIMEQAGKAVEGYDKARILLVPPPVIQGIGAAGGYRYMLQDREGRAMTR
jgi:multidrug efflux pump subunit AcrB